MSTRGRRQSFYFIKRTKYQDEDDDVFLKCDGLLIKVYGQVFIVVLQIVAGKPYGLHL